MIEISVTGLNLYFGERQILRDLSFELQTGERASIVGPNGCGKTTLFKVLAGLLPYDGGQVSIARGRRIGLLEQLPDVPPELTVRQVLWQAFENIEQLGARLRAMEEEMAAGKEVDMRAYATMQTAFEDGGGYDLEVAYQRMVSGLGIPPDMQTRPFMSLSGGEKTRVNLARIMLSGVDILLLDEPTNHLDLQSIEWLEGYLRAFKGTVLIISHDRYFLDRVTSRTLEMRDGSLTSYPGNYSEYVDRRDEMMELLEKQKKRQDKEIERLSFTVERMKGWGLGNKKVMKRAFAMEKRLQRIERIETIRRQHKMKNRFAEADRSGNEVLQIEGLSIGYDRPLIEDFSAMVFRGERIALLGPNGCGKTTLLTTLLRLQPALRGVFYEGTGVKEGYLPQVVSFDHPERNLVDTLLYETRADTQQARDRLAAFGFTGEEVFKTVEVLSGGEKTRLKLCLFMNTGVNTLFLDEPTNHLDILSREWLEDAIDEFSETMIFVSHDRYFINRFATRIWQVQDGRVRDFVGTYEEFRAVLAREAAQKAQHRPAETAVKAIKKDKPEKENLKLRQKQQRENLRRIAALEKELEEIEAEMAANPDDYQRLSELLARREQAEEELLLLYEQTEE
ncbi:MAG TPA: ABC-F family ATP-binding cassette domain-containing protein [Candidatus Ventrousia excrementavium]|uniref:ABC-F family ATP-binding cassette domain-containing protein n=1 Tax=Candidatus Ventrousia excrementavium TaxID=2840961 RepID=A0A9D1IU43_9CLOT|nr:ABC-F family ATP-binding cassette domain-containing protein [Candidatus Ventrousia excrementavium]